LRFEVERRGEIGARWEELETMPRLSGREPGH